MLHDAVVVCERAFVAEEIGAQLTDSVWVSFAEVGNGSVTGFVACRVIKMIPGTDSELFAGEAVSYVRNTGLAVSDTLLDNFTSKLRLVVPLGWVPREEGVDRGSGDAGHGCGGRDGGAGQDVG